MDRVVPEGKDFTRLTVGELDTASRKLGEDVLGVIAQGSDDGPAHPRRWAAFALLAWLWAKRQDPKVEIATFEALEVDELLAVLGMDDEDEDDVETPTTPAPA